MSRRLAHWLIPIIALPTLGLSCPPQLPLSRQVIVQDPSSEIGGVLVGSTGDSSTILAQKDSSGSVTKVTGVHYHTGDGTFFTLILGPNGLPAHLVSGQRIISFFNYTSDGADFVVAHLDGSILDDGRVSFGSTQLARLRALHADNLVGAASSKTLTADKLAARIALPDVFEIGGVVTGVLGCGAGLIGYAPALGNCLTSPLSLLNLVLDSESLAGTLTTLNTASCTAGDLFSCAGLGFDVARRISLDRQVASDSNSDGMPDIVEQALASSFDGTYEYVSGNVHDSLISALSFTDGRLSAIHVSVNIINGGRLNGEINANAIGIPQEFSSNEGMRLLIVTILSVASRFDGRALDLEFTWRTVANPDFPSEMLDAIRTVSQQLIVSVDLQEMEGDGFVADENGIHTSEGHLRLRRR